MLQFLLSVAIAALLPLEQRIVPGLPETLVATRPASYGESMALATALERFRASGGLESLEAFLEHHPESAWRLALHLNLGIGYEAAGRTSRSIAALRAAWSAGRHESAPPLRALADRAAGELARVYARLGHAAELESLLEEIGERPVTGAAGELVIAAREALWMFRHHPEASYRCGPVALANLLHATGADDSAIRRIRTLPAGPHGSSLAELSALAAHAGFAHRVVHRVAGTAIPVPSLVHWRTDHFAAIVALEDGRYRIQDPTFGSADRWVTAAAIDAEGSGYFLVPGPGRGWREAAAEEADAIRGAGFTSVNELGATKTVDLGIRDAPCTSGVCVDAKSMLVSLNLTTVPVGYDPARGPSMKVRLSYNQREASQPATFGFFNLGPKWSMNFLSWIQDDPAAPGRGVIRFPGGGGSVDYSMAPYVYDAGSGAFSPDRQGQATLVRIPASGALASYELRLTDGSKLVYARLDGATVAPRRVFLTRVIDPAGNALTLNYDSQLRVTSINDAVGRPTRFNYGDGARPLLLTGVVDPFGRSAAFAYDSLGRLSSVTDVLGLRTTFAYDAAGLVNAMATPYGTSTFTFGTVDTTRFLEIRDPLGQTERVEFAHNAPGVPDADPVAPPSVGNFGLAFRNTFHWDKGIYTPTGRDPLQARITHWLKNSAGATSPIVESTKLPLERRIWYRYPGQAATDVEGEIGAPARIARVLDDGTAQATELAYNAAGLQASVTDPVGRRTVYAYAPNNLNVLSVQQKVGESLATIESFTWGNQHRPLTSTDAAGRATRYLYNPAGQLTSLIDALGRTTTTTYDALGRRLSIFGPSGAALERRAYDDLDRLVSRIDAAGYEVRYAYDAADRITEIRYPDGTTTQYAYDRLDLAAMRDRLGRLTRYAYDAERRLVGVTDPLERTVRYAYHGNGALANVTDPKGNVTAWLVDIQGRPIAKRYADGSMVELAYEASTDRLAATRDALGQGRSFGYFADDRLRSITYAGAVNPTANVTFADDPFFPRRTAMTDGLGTTTWAYVPIGAPGALRLAEENGPYATNDGILYAYDALGRVVSRTIDSAVETFAYDALGRLVTHAGALGTFNFGYLGETTQLASRSASTGTVATRWEYESNVGDRRLRAIAQSGGMRSFGYASVPEGLVTGQNESIGGTPTRSLAYAYDAVSRLVSGFTYDPADNLTSGGASYNGLNQIVGLRYDANGNLLDDGAFAFGWDAENRLVSITHKASGARTTMRHDGLGRRLAIIDSGVETRYLWCGEVLCQARDAADTVVRRYFEHGVAYPQTGAALYYGRDHTGSVRDVSAVQTGALVGSFDYAAYGVITGASGSVAPEHLYAGMFMHAPSGLYLARDRVYDPRSARWISRAPAAESAGLNLYAYARGNPVALPVEASGALGYPRATPPAAPEARR